MTFTPEHDQFRQTVRRFVDEKINPQIDEWERAEMMPLHEIIGDMAELGFVGLEYDPGFGGQGADHLFTLVLAEELGRVHNTAFPTAFGVHVAMATPSLHAHGSNELKEQFLTPAMNGDMIAAIAVTEPDAGSDVAAIKTTARRDSGDWVVSGSKMYITNALQADWMCVLVRTSDEGSFAGMSQLIVPLKTRGVEVHKLDKLGMRASDTGLITLDDVRVPVSNTIGEVGRGFQQQMSQFVIERMWGTYVAASGFKSALDRTKEYATNRRIFGKPLAANQYLAYQFAELVARTEMLAVFNRHVAVAHTAGEDVTRSATIAKMTMGKLAREVADWCLQVHGGIGYMEETWTARYFRDQRIASIGGGADEVMMRVLSQLEGFTG